MSTDANLTLTQIAPDGLRGVWHLIRPALTRLASRTRVDWIPEDLYHACTLNRATLYLVYRGSDLEGFCIVHMRPRPDEPSIKELFVWVSAAIGEYSKWHVAAVQVRLEEIARQHGAKHMAFKTFRKGWLRSAPKLGYTMTEMTFEKPL